MIINSIINTIKAAFNLVPILPTILLIIILIIIFIIKLAYNFEYLDE